MKQSPSNANYNYWYGACCVETGADSLATPYLEKAAKRKVLDARTRGHLTDLILMAALPCSIIDSFQMTLSAQILMSTLSVLLISIAIQGLYWIWNRLFYHHEGIDRRICLKYATMVSNAGFIGMPVCDLKSEDFSRFKVVDYVLGGYFGSRLMRNIREEKGYTYGISSYIVPLRFQGVWMISSEVKADCTALVMAEIEKEIEKLKRREIPMSELELVRQAYMGDFLRELDGTFDLAERMKFFILIGQGACFYERNEEVLFSMTPAGIKEAARRFLDNSRFCSVTVGASDS